MTLSVVFDVGGVLIDWNPRHLYRKLLPDETAIDAFLDEVGFHAWNAQQDAGRAWDQAVADLAGRFPHRRALIEAADGRWPEMVAGPIAGTVAILEALHESGTPLFAITNFSSAKWRLTQERFSFLNRFRDIVVSGDERVVKPEADIFRRFLDRNDLAPEECLFIDDSPVNTKGAAAIGMRPVRFQSPDALREALAEHGIRV